MMEELIADAGVVVAIAVSGAICYAAVGAAGVEHPIARLVAASILTVSAICGAVFLRERHYGRKYGLLRQKMEARRRAARRN
ncbi:hypothetical protein OIU34_21205 [Pararhizobium sp. BT-229]|uniref:hypothetical protein n=1 Tax=Pararhizobium sp. BT-229 TaxID=2986923 RepID=UPI0021F75A39|nr:hypothetical protein [Pararhizobium sp. BT-229]MCV9964410.1 hypothetical protein [Pararhizobium sp. BT-229]